MGFKSFSALLWLRIILIVVSTILCVLFYVIWLLVPLGTLFTILLITQSLELHRFINSTNRKLTQFLESVEYSDFATTFTVDNALGTTFKDLNKSFNKVLNIFRNTRMEKEEHLQYLNLVVEHVETGLISFNKEGKIDVLNKIGIHLLGIKRIHNLSDLKSYNEELYAAIINLEPGQQTTFMVRDNVNLAIRATQFVRRGEFIKLIALHNIYAELAKKEVDSWQKLMSVLRHEIMNSMTPISSLASTMKTIMKEDLIRRDDVFELSESTINDLTESLETIASRSNGLVSFVQAYRDYTSLPSPHPITFKIKALFERVVSLMKQNKQSVSIVSDCQPLDLEIFADEQLIEQVLINLVKNSVEACENNTKGAEVKLIAYKNNQFVIVEVEDNGTGIVPEAIDKIFIPFYTNKKTGSGIGLSLSKQIMNLHNGSLQVTSIPHIKTVFKLQF